MLNSSNSEKSQASKVSKTTRGQKATTIAAEIISKLQSNKELHRNDLSEKLDAFRGKYIAHKLSFLRIGGASELVQSNKGTMDHDIFTNAAAGKDDIDAYSLAATEAEAMKNAVEQALNKSKGPAV